VYKEYYHDRPLSLTIVHRTLWVHGRDSHSRCHRVRRTRRRYHHPRTGIRRRRVRGLGVQTSQEEFAEAAKTHDSDAVLVSSLYGHAEQDCQGFQETLAEHDVDAVTYIGGNLAVGQNDFAEIRETFQNMGFDRVFDSETSPEEAIRALERDCKTAERDTERITA